MKVLITGATGFVGSHLLELFLNNNYQVQILLRPESNTWRIAHLISHNNINLLYGDLNDIGQSDLKNSINSFEPESIIHLAWQGVGNKDRNDTQQLLNIQQSIELVKLAKGLNVKSFIGLGSQAEYGPCSNIISELQPTLPTTCYGIAKLSTSLVLQDLCEQFNIRYAWLRLFSSYGPKDNDSWLIPYLINSFKNNINPDLTKCEQRWDYIHVADVASAIYSIVISSQANGIFNLGSGQANKLIDIVNYINNKTNPDIKANIGAVPYRPDQVMHLEADITRLKKYTNWTPRKNLYQGLDETIEWFAQSQVV